MVIEVAAIDPLVAEAARRAPARLANLGESNGGVGVIKQSRMPDPRPDGLQPSSGATDEGGECGTPLLYTSNRGDNADVLSDEHDLLQHRDMLDHHPHIHNHDVKDTSKGEGSLGDDAPPARSPRQLCCLLCLQSSRSRGCKSPRYGK